MSSLPRLLNEMRGLLFERATPTETQFMLDFVRGGTKFGNAATKALGGTSFAFDREDEYGRGPISKLLGLPVSWHFVVKKASTPSSPPQAAHFAVGFEEQEADERGGGAGVILGTVAALDKGTRKVLARVDGLGNTDQEPMGKAFAKIARKADWAE